MLGKVFFDSELPPKVGDTVYVYVAAPYYTISLPQGLWSARLTRVNERDVGYECGPIQTFVPPQNTKGRHCEFDLVDPKLLSQVQAGFLQLGAPEDYYLFTSPLAFEVARHLWGQSMAEVKGLNRRLEIERQAMQGLFKALVSGDAFARLEKLLADFIGRLSQKP